MKQIEELAAELAKLRDSIPQPELPPALVRAREALQKAKDEHRAATAEARRIAASHGDQQSGEPPAELAEAVAKERRLSEIRSAAKAEEVRATEEAGPDYLRAVGPATEEAADRLVALIELVYLACEPLVEANSRAIQTGMPSNRAMRAALTIQESLRDFRVMLRQG